MEPIWMTAMKYWLKVSLFNVILTALLCACTFRQGGGAVDPQAGNDSEKVWVMSDDSLVSVCWWDTGQGGTAPDIEAVCRFTTEKGELKEETKPLLSIVHPQYDWSHHEVLRIADFDTEYGIRVYFFFMRAKEGSNEFSHDIIALTVEGDSLRPVNIMKVEDKRLSHISLDGLMLAL